MPAETSRKSSVRRIYAPGTLKGDSSKTYIPLKVIDEITFKESVPPGQEWILSFKNNPTDAAREVRVKEVGKEGDKIKVERIDTLSTTNSDGIQQQAIWSFLGNKDEPPVHLDTYKTKIYLSDEQGNIVDRDVWIEVERVRAIEFKDSKDDVPGQDYIWTLHHPDEQDSKYNYTGVSEAVTQWDFGDINPPYRIDPFQMIVDCSFGGALAVFYGDNKVAAISMSELANGKIKVTSRKTLTQSSWTPSWDCKLFKTQQLKLSKDQSIILSPLKGLPTGRVSYSDKFVLTTSKFKSERVTDGLSTYENPFFCGSDGALHLNSGDASISSNGSILSYTKWSGFVGENAYAAFIVNGNGERYYGFHVLNTSHSVDQFVSAFMDWVSPYQPSTYHLYDPPLDIPMQPTYSSTYTSYYTIGYDDYWAKHDEVNGELPQGVSTRGTSIFYKGSVCHYDYTASYGDQFFGTSTTKGSMSATLEYASHQNVSGKSELTFKTLTISCSADIPLRSDGFVSINVGGFYSASSPAPYYDDTQTQRPDIAVVFWPPTTQGNPPWLYIRDAAQETYPPYDLSNGVEKIVTPYGEIQSGNWDYNNDYEFNISPSFHPWLHLSDGKNLIQACEFGGKRYIWINGSEKSAAIAAAIGCDVKDIRTMLLDVGIGKLK